MPYAGGILPAEKEGSGDRGRDQILRAGMGSGQGASDGASGVAIRSEGRGCFEKRRRKEKG